MRLPEIVGVRLTGRRQGGITATDIVLAPTEFLRQQKSSAPMWNSLARAPTARSIGDRATISNMCPEYGATAAMFSIDDQTLAYLRLTGRDEAQVRLVEAYARTAGFWSDSLADARYERVLQFDLSTVVRNMAGPSNPHRRLPTSALAERGIADAAKLQAPRAQEAQGLMPDGAVIIAAITSCTNTSNPRNVIAAALLARNANRLGLVRKPWVKSSLAPGSKAVELYLKEAGLLTELEQLGFGIEIIERDLYATAVLSGNRNFDGRIHPQAKQAFLASPPLVVAYALAGTIRFDIEQDVLAVVDGREIRLKDLWPADEEIDAIVEQAVKPAQFRAVYEPMFAIHKDDGNKASPQYDWRPQSTYIRRPPYWDTEGVGALAAFPRTLTGMRPLALLPDNITTDHLSPSNAILADSAAGEYLARMGLPEEDFNSYATHRGDHLTAMRATFANPQLVNEMAVIDGVQPRARWRASSPKGAWCHVGGHGNLPEPPPAADHHRGRRLRPGLQPRLGRQGVRLAGVEAVVAEGFERIHRTNLIGMGVLPLQFVPGTNRRPWPWTARRSMAWKASARREPNSLW
ncbi:Cytoplasmic aconitate hydratase [Manis javanica]|nr:Cytoplasmic aconitate hydratase [Manis javanica]